MLESKSFAVKGCRYALNIDIVRDNVIVETIIAVIGHGATRRLCPFPGRGEARYFAIRARNAIKECFC